MNPESRSVKRCSSSRAIFYLAAGACVLLLKTGVGCFGSLANFLFPLCLRNGIPKLSRTTNFTDNNNRREAAWYRRHAANMSQPSITNFILKRPWLQRWMQPMASWYCNAAGYRKLGLRYGSYCHCTGAKPYQLFMSMERTRADCFVHYRADDLIPEESETVLLALKRLPPKEAYDRVFRLRRAFQVSNLPRTT